MNKLTIIFIFSVLIIKCSTNQSVRSDHTYQGKISRNNILREEIQSSSVTTAYGVIELLRPGWFYTIETEYQNDLTRQSFMRPDREYDRKDPIRCIIFHNKKKLGEDENMLHAIPAESITLIRFTTGRNRTIRVYTEPQDNQ